LDEPYLIGYFRVVFVIIDLQHFYAVVGHPDVVFCLHQIFDSPETGIVAESFYYRVFLEEIVALHLLVIE
jgi:hypothetical protein